MSSIVITGRPEAPRAAVLAGSEQYLTFTLGNELFAIGILHIKEIIEYGTPTPVPLMPAFIHGVINLRGAVVPVIDLSVRFGKARSDIGRRTCIIILEMELEGHNQDIGVIVDAVSAVLDIPASEIEPPPAFGSRIKADYILGMGKLGERFAILLNVRRAFSMDEMAALQHWQAEPLNG